MTKILIYIAIFVGAIVIALWASKELSYLLEELLYWMRQNWLTVFSVAVIAVIGYKVVK